VEVPVATYAGWNYRATEIGSPDQFMGEAGSIYPFAPTRARRPAGDSRMSIEERYTSREQYLGKIALTARQLIDGGFCWLPIFLT
jgi:hypothetical protein